jgi:hypothetical protein
MSTARKHFMLNLEYTGKGASLDTEIEKAVGQPRRSSGFDAITGTRDMQFRFDSEYERERAKERIGDHPALRGEVVFASDNFVKVVDSDHILD